MKRKHYLLLLALMMGLVGFSACSSDDNGGDEGGGDVDAPTLTTEAACYVVNDEEADIASIELTETGLYFIEQRDESDYGAKKNTVRFRGVSKRKALNAQALDLDDPSEEAILTGTYTKSAEGVYVLNGYGTMTVTANGNSYAVKLQKLGGEEKTYQTSRVKSAAASTFDTQLCRTWKFESINFTAKYGSYTMANITANSWKDFYTKLKKLAKDNCDEEDPWTDEDEQEYNQMIANAEVYGLKQAVFTAAGRLYLSYGSLVKNYLWKWKSGKTLSLWCYDNDLDEDGMADANEWNSDIFFTTTGEPNFSAVTTVDIKNGKLILTDTNRETEEDEGGVIEQKMTVTFSK